MSELEPRAVVTALIKAAAPERAAELFRFLADHDPSVQMTGPGPAEMKAGRERIAFNRDMLDAVWLYAFSAWHAIETYMPGVMGSHAMGMTVDDVLRNDAELGPLEHAYKSRMAMAAGYSKSAGQGGRDWPDDVPHPTGDRASLDHQGQAAFDLASIALAAILLHETRHVKFANDGQRPEDAAEEEMTCDVFARSFLIERIGDYVATSGEPFAAVANKRAIGLTAAAIAIHGLTPTFARWGSASYPSVGERLEALLGNMPVGADENFWKMAASLLVGMMRQDHTSIDIVCTNYRTLTEVLIGRLK